MNSSDRPQEPVRSEDTLLGRPDPSVIERGYEEDRYDAASVFSVPLIVVVFFVLAFGVTTILFYYLAPGRADPSEHPLAVERNSVPLNERLSRIRRGGEVDQPRLEPLKLRAGDARAITQPELREGNSPEYHPEDLRPSPETTPDLYKIEQFTNELVRIDIDTALRLATEPRIAAKLLPARKDGKRPTYSFEKSTAYNAGRIPKMQPQDH